MAQRISLPGELQLDAVVVQPATDYRLMMSQSDPNDWAQLGTTSDELLRRIAARPAYVALRWVLNPAVGMPVEPFTVWRRPSSQRGPARPIPSWSQQDANLFGWDGLTEMVLIELDVSTEVTVRGLPRNRDEAVAEVTGGPGTILLTGGPMVRVWVDKAGAVTGARGLSVNALANSDGWIAIERVGLPLKPELQSGSYYQPGKQGPIDALTDPQSAAVDRLQKWGPLTGWAPLAGLPSWVAPLAKRLVYEFNQSLLPDLVSVLAANPPPHVSAQVTADAAPHPLPELHQIVGDAPGKALDGSTMVTRPMQTMALGSATDCWASLALGFGTGAEIGRRDGRTQELDDFMVTAPWSGEMKVAVMPDFPWPFGSGGPPPEYITKPVERELAAIVLGPRARAAPNPPTPVFARTSFVEGAAAPDTPFTAATKIETPRQPLRPGQAGVSAYALARFDKPGVGQHRLREHPVAGGWIAIGSAAPVRDPATPPDPALTPGAVMLRDSRVPMPITGAPLQYQYAIAATDLFGRWSKWSTAWMTTAPADIQVPLVTVARAKATVGATGGDPCRIDTTVEIVWDASERTCRRLHLVVDLFDPYPAPPAPLAVPPATPQPGLAVSDVTIGFDAQGMPALVPAGLTVTPLHPDDTPVTAAAPFTGAERRYRIVWSALPATFGGAREKALAVYAQGEETVRPGEWGAHGHPREMTIAANPIPPAAPVPDAPAYPLWASLPDAAGISYAPVAWQPSGAWRYRVYEATEAALLAACDEPGPDLTQRLSLRLQKLFDLHTMPQKRAALKAAFRKLGDEPILPPIEADGRMRYQARLPRGSGLIHCFVVVAVSESNVISGWPVPDPGKHGRDCFTAYAIPRPVTLSVPEIRARLTDGAPEVAVVIGGEVPVTAIHVYRATRPVLARQVGTMALVATAAPTAVAVAAGDPPAQAVLFADPGAPRGWDYVQYRAVAHSADDPDRAIMAVASPPSKAFSLLYPPLGPPSLALAEIASLATAARAIVQLATDAPMRSSQAGDHLLAWSARQGANVPAKGSRTLASLPAFDTLDALAAGVEPAARVGTSVYLKLDRADGAALDIAADLTDPLGRSTHATLSLPTFKPVAQPLITALTATRHNTVLDKAVWVRVACNVAYPADPGQDWVLRFSSRRLPFSPLGPSTVRSFPVSTIPIVPTAGAVPLPHTTAATFMIRRASDTGEFVFWFRAKQAYQVTLTLTNSVGQAVKQTASSQ